LTSYSHKDRKLRDKLAAHLSNLRNQQLITDWFDGDIIEGTEWEPQILKHLQSAQIILLLISADFLGSKFCYSTEMTQSIARCSRYP
jgi:TIR domain